MGARCDLPSSSCGMEEVWTRASGQEQVAQARLQGELVEGAVRENEGMAQGSVLVRVLGHATDDVYCRLPQMRTAVDD